MKSALILTAFSALATAVYGNGVGDVVPRDPAPDGYLQLSTGYASFTLSSGCAAPGKQLRGVALPQERTR